MDATDCIRIVQAFLLFLLTVVQIAGNAGLNAKIKATNDTIEETIVNGSRNDNLCQR